jgi:hypothetical protein
MMVGLGTERAIAPGTVAVGWQWSSLWMRAIADSKYIPTEIASFLAPAPRLPQLTELQKGRLRLLLLCTTQAVGPFT